MAKKNIRVAVLGAYGRMGRSVVAAVSAEKDMEVAGAVDVAGVGEDVGTVAGVGARGVLIRSSLWGKLRAEPPGVIPDVIVDFTTAEGFWDRASEALASGVRLVVGTTGIDGKTLKRVEKLAEKKKLGVLVAPNFAIGAVLMMEFAAKAAAYMPDAEIIEFHHNRKLDAPSGTAMATAERIARARLGKKTAADPTKIVKLEGARGGNLGGVPVHSVRLEGFLACQEVIMGGPGQTLTIRHDTISRESFMPGVILAVRKVMKLNKMVYGLEKVI